MANSPDVILDPKRQQTCDHLQKCFERSYDLSKSGDQRTLVEALTEIGKATALTGTTATVKFSFGENGITGVNLTSVPKPVVS